MAEYGLMDIMPENLLADKNIRNIVEVIDEKLRDSYKQTEYPAIISRIDELDSDVLDSLAWQYNVDFYDPAINVENKRKLIRESIAWHRLKGTSAAVAQLVSAIFGPSSVQEWYEYGGEPYHFRITSSGFDPAGKTIKDILCAVEMAKNTRSCLDDITIDAHPDMESDPVNQYYGLANTPIGRKTIKLSFPKGHKHKAHTGVALSWGGVKHIGFQSPSDFQYDSFIAFADAKTGRKTIGFDTDDLHYTPLGDLELFFKTGAVYINAGKKHIEASEYRRTAYTAETRAGMTNIVYGTRVIGGLKYLDDMLSKAFGGMYSIRRGTMKIGGLR